MVGFFLDHANYANNNATSYTAEMQYLFHMQNLTFGEDGGLMRQCEAAFPRDQKHNCVMSPHMMQFIQTPLFVFNSRYVHALAVVRDLRDHRSIYGVKLSNSSNIPHVCLNLCRNASQF